ncbi:MAG: NAD(P)/FAD-dependent oxidoreductase [Vulcanimicrobiaceae bacterium]
MPAPVLAAVSVASRSASFRPAYDADIAVVGGGIIGTAAALALQADGYRVLIVEPNEVGAGTAAGSAGYLHDGEIFPLAEPGLLAKLPRMLLDPLGPLVIQPAYLPLLVGWGRRFLRASRRPAIARAIAGLASLNRLAVDSTVALAEDSGAGHLLARAGGLKVCRDERTLEAVAAELLTLKEAGIEAQTIGRDALLALEPAISPEVAGAVFFPTSAHCTDPQAFGERLAARARGASIRNRATKLTQIADKSWVVELDGATRQRISAQRVLICAGAWSAPLMRSLRYTVPLAMARGYHLMLSNPGIELKHPIIFFEPHFAATPMLDGIRLAGTVEFAPAHAPMKPHRSEMLYDLAKRYLPRLRSEPSTMWMGVRSMTPDSLPVIGKAQRHENLYYSFGHGHLGFTQAAISARCIADVIGGRTPPIDVAPFDLDRFARG